MMGVVVAFLNLVLILASYILQALLFLLKRFDITNSILVSGLIQLLTLQLGPC